MEVAIKRHILRQIKSPLNYIGGKAKLLDQILPLNNITFKVWLN